MSDTDPDPSVDPAEPSAPLLRLLQLLDLRAEGVDDRGQDLFVGDSERQPHGRVYGGQVLGQTIVAAARTVPEDRLIHSMHGYFLRPGDAEKPITFAVERLRDGRSFTARRVHAIQHGKPILSMIASFQDEGTGLDHQDRMPDVPDPETLASIDEIARERYDEVAKRWPQGRPVDIRHVSPPGKPTDGRPEAAANAVWVRTRGPLPDDQMLHRAVLGFASDYAILEPVLRRNGKYWTTPGLKAASLDHAMWWHRPVHADEWMLYTLVSPSASGARGLGIGRIFSRDGALVATVGQEGMLRLPLD